MGIDQFIVHIHLSPDTGTVVSYITLFQSDDLFLKNDLRLSDFLFFLQV